MVFWVDIQKNVLTAIVNAQPIFSSFSMLQTIVNLLDDSINRKRQRCDYETAFSHEIIKQWFEGFIEAENWTIVIPKYNSRKCKAVSHWPNKIHSKSVLSWLTKQKCTDAKDLLDGACEPLALYLSVSIHSDIQRETFVDLNYSQRSALQQLENMRPFEATRTIFQHYINPRTRGPHFWNSTFQGSSHADFLFGSEALKLKVTSVIKQDSAILYLPLYIISYLFDNDELTEEDLSRSTEESAQYSCHVVGLVFDRKIRRIIVADPNGPLIPGFNMEFLKIPLIKRSAPSTKLSSFDLEKVNKVGMKRKMN